MSKHDRQRAAFAFLVKVGSNGTFSLAALAKAADWTPSTATTHISKHYNDWVLSLGGGQYRVLPEFFRVTEEQFVRHCSLVLAVPRRDVRARA